MDLVELLSGTAVFVAIAAAFVWAFSKENEKGDVQYWKKLAADAFGSYITTPLSFMLFSLGLAAYPKTNEVISFSAFGCLAVMLFFIAGHRDTESFTIISTGFIFLLFFWTVPCFVFVMREEMKVPQYYTVFVSLWLFVADIYTFFYITKAVEILKNKISSKEKIITAASVSKLLALLIPTAVGAFNILKEVIPVLKDLHLL